MTNRRSSNVNSIAEQVAITQEALKGLPELPAHMLLRDKDKPHIEKILAGRPRKDWSEYDLTIAVQLARIKADLEDEQKLLFQEDTVIGEGKKRMVNPRLTVVERLERRATALSRALHLIATSEEARTQDKKGKTAAEKRTERAIGFMTDNDDGLLNHPNPPTQTRQ